MQDYLSQVPDDYLDHGAHVDRDTKTMRLGLPVSHLFPSLRQKYAELRLDKDGQLPIKFGLDDIYLPYDPKTTEANAVVPIQISADRAKGGSISVGGSNVPISADQRKILADRGEVFIRGDRQVLRVALSLDPPAVASADTPVAARSLFASKPVSGPTATPRARQPVHRGRHLPSYEIGLFTSYEQLWDLKGYSRGSLVNAITLAPSENFRSRCLPGTA